MTSEESNGFIVKLNKHIRVPADRAFDAFTKPDLLSKWFTTSAEVNLTVGGRYKNADKDEGEYLVINWPNQLHFTWENPEHCPGTVVEIEFEPRSGDSVEILLRHKGIETQQGHNDMKRGWSWALDSLHSYLEKGTPIPFSEWESSQLKRR
jgi:uncharacterized protein YndB with AHSA1/START domain